MTIVMVTVVMTMVVVMVIELDDRSIFVSSMRHCGCGDDCHKRYEHSYFVVCTV